LNHQDPKLAVFNRVKKHCVFDFVLRQLEQYKHKVTTLKFFHPKDMGKTGAATGATLQVVIKPLLLVADMVEVRATVLAVFYLGILIIRSL
jgi:hypothetical protein